MDSIDQASLATRVIRTMNVPGVNVEAIAFVSAEDRVFLGLNLGGTRRYDNASTLMDGLTPSSVVFSSTGGSILGLALDPVSGRLYAMENGDAPPFPLPSRPPGVQVFNNFRAAGGPFSQDFKLTGGLAGFSGLYGTWDPDLDRLLVEDEFFSRLLQWDGARTITTNVTESLQWTNSINGSGFTLDLTR